MLATGLDKELLFRPFGLIQVEHTLDDSGGEVETSPPQTIQYCKDLLQAASATSASFSVTFHFRMSKRPKEPFLR